MNNIRELLKNRELKIVLESPDKDYQFEYYTSSIKEETGGSLRLNRAYRLIDLARGAVTQNPWDNYDIDKHVNLIQNLIQFSNYKIVEVISGWQGTCLSCGNTSSWKIWEKIPDKCGQKVPRRCAGNIVSGPLVYEWTART
jgi:hypothetical protein